MTAPVEKLLLPSLIVVLSGALWGFYWIPLRFLEAEGLTGPSAGSYLNLAPALILTMIAIASGARLKAFQECFLAGALIGLGIALFSTGILYAPVARVTLLFYLMPIWSTIVGYLWLGEKISWARARGIVCGLIGLALLVSGRHSIALNIGDLFGLLSGLCWTFGAALIKKHPEMPIMPLSAIQFLVAAAGSILLVLVLAEPIPDAATLWKVTPLVFIVAVTLLVPTVLGLTWAQTKLFPGRVGILLMSEVLVSLVSASVLLPEERLQGLQWLGCALIVGAFLVETLGSAAQSDQDSPD